VAERVDRVSSELPVWKEKENTAASNKPHFPKDGIKASHVIKNGQNA